MLVARQSGKSSVVAAVSIGLAIILPVLSAIIKDPKLKVFAKGFTVGCYAPEFKQATIVFSRMRDLINSIEGKNNLRNMGIRVTVNRGDTVQFDHGGRAFVKSAALDAKVEGETCNLIILDEAQDLLETKINKEIRPQVLATGGTIVGIGTVGYRKDFFYNQIQTGLDAERDGSKKRYHFQFDYAMVIKEKLKMYKRVNDPVHLNYEQVVQKEIARLGGLKMAEQNTEFKMNYMLRWDHSISNFLPIEAKKVIQNTKYRLNDPNNKAYPMVVGIDLAKERDKTVMIAAFINTKNPIIAPDGETKYYKKDIIFVEELHGGWEYQFPKMCKFITEKEAIYVVVDATGLGSPIVERLAASLPGVSIEPFIFGPKSKDELYRHYADEIMAGRMRIASSPVCTASYEWTSFMKEHLTAEKEMKGQNFQYLTIRPQMGVGDDYVDSGSLACWAAKIYTDNFMRELVIEPNVFHGFSQVDLRPQKPEDLPDTWPDTPTARRWKRIKEQPSRYDTIKSRSWRRSSRRIRNT
jgi:hypothetical protein